MFFFPTSDAKVLPWILNMFMWQAHVSDSPSGFELWVSFSMMPFERWRYRLSKPEQAVSCNHLCHHLCWIMAAADQ